ncbi:hypothetical protein MY4824_008153 [Beauveria thailandica]
MDSTPVEQPDFSAVASGLRLAAEHLARCPNVPALDAGAELMRRMDMMLEQQRLLSEQQRLLSAKIDSVIISNRNAAVRHENSIVVSGEMALAPLYDLRTGEEIAECPGTLAQLEALAAPQVAELLRRVGEPVPRGHEERKRKLKQAFGVRTQVI